MCAHGYCSRHIHYCERCRQSRDGRSRRSRGSSSHANSDNYTNTGTPDRPRRRQDDNNDSQRRKSFPILDYGNERYNKHLTKWEWFQFQCIMFWETYPVGLRFPSPQITFDWLKQPHGTPDFFSKEDVEDTLSKWRRFQLRYYPRVASRGPRRGPPSSKL